MGCPKPELDESNFDAWEIFQTMSHQPRIGGMGGYIGIDFNMFEPICNAYLIPQSERRNLLDKIIILNKVSGDFYRAEEAARSKESEQQRN